MEGVLIIVLGLSWILVGVFTVWPVGRDLWIALADVETAQGRNIRWWPKRIERFALPVIGVGFLALGCVFLIVALSTFG